MVRVLANAADAYNAIEPYIWYAVGLGVIPALRLYARLGVRLLLAGLLAGFGTSDFFEHDGWWTPWWLLAWKAGSIGAIVIVAHHAWRGSRRAGQSTSP